MLERRLLYSTDASELGYLLTHAPGSVVFQRQFLSKPTYVGLLARR
jgi:hypothetical protein